MSKNAGSDYKELNEMDSRPQWLLFPFWEGSVGAWEGTTRLTLLCFSGLLCLTWNLAPCPIIIGCWVGSTLQNLSRRCLLKVNTVAVTALSPFSLQVRTLRLKGRKGSIYHYMEGHWAELKPTIFCSICYSRLVFYPSKIWGAQVRDGGWTWNGRSLV